MEKRPNLNSLIIRFHNCFNYGWYIGNSKIKVANIWFCESGGLFWARSLNLLLSMRIGNEATCTVCDKYIQSNIGVWTHILWYIARDFEVLVDLQKCCLSNMPPVGVLSTRQSWGKCFGTAGVHKMLTFLNLSANLKASMSIHIA